MIAALKSARTLGTVDRAGLRGYELKKRLILKEITEEEYSKGFEQVLKTWESARTGRSGCGAAALAILLIAVVTLASAFS